MTVMYDDVVCAYRWILGREPENALAIEGHLSAQDRSTLRNAFLNSQEFRRSIMPKSDLDKMYDGLCKGDEELLERHLAPAAPETSYVGNFLGTLMQSEFTEPTTKLSGYVYDEIPTIIGDYHAEAIEFVGLLRAVEAGSGPFVAVELGAGWGSWSVSAGHVARRLGRTPIRLYAVEASEGKVANMRSHYQKNGFNPDEHCLITAAVGPSDQAALFPIVDVTKDWGGKAIFIDDGQPIPSIEGYETVKCVRLSTLIATETKVDLIHFDIQGAEKQVITESINILNNKVRFIIVGTHSRSVEGALIDLMIANSWHLVNEQPARISPSSNGGEHILVDGTQVWRNPRID